ncbi:Hypp1210 [Branchiostoma lanceolatum]|uniref:Hypp1210 protein n=1 Tax=Branchiostoma lanceolatum TaxID=7740 RepID=A0A8J9ZH84_BRALA|nr:Hypp1210 [Branchiostoma lanceolatum]
MGLTSREKEEVIPGIIDTRIKATIEDTIVNAFQQGGVLAAIVPTIVSAVREAVVASIQAELAKYHEELHQQREEFKDLTTQYNNLKDEHSTLQAKVNNLEQYSRRNCVIISGIPESPGERSTDNAVLSVANDKLRCDPQLTINDIDRSHRLGKPRGDGKPRPIIAKFCSYRSKATIMRAKATTSGRAVLRESGIFVNDNLTKANMSLLKDARSLVKLNLLNQAWSYDGKIFIKTLKDERRLLFASVDLDIYRVSK